MDALATSHGWLDDLDGERIRDLWTELFPALQEHVVVAGFDSQERLLALRPLNRAAAAHIRLHEPQLLAILAEAVGDQVRGLKVLLPDARPAAGIEACPPADAPTEPRAPATAPLQIQRPGSEEYLRTRETLRALRLPRIDDAEEKRDPFAGTRNTMREPSEPRQPTSPALRRQQAERTHRLALARARTERQEKKAAM